jgi:trans-aconitate 2-methyltransferase
MRYIGCVALNPEKAAPVNRNDAGPPNAWNAALYEDKHSFVWKEAGAVFDLLAPRPGESILDVGCGTGQLTAAIAAAGASVTGIDSSAEMIGKARQNYPALRFEVADAGNLNFHAQFDAAFSNAVLHWIREAGSVAGGVSRALKPGGRFVAEFGGKGNIRQILAALHGAARQLQFDIESPWYFPSVAEYSHILESNGMEVLFAALIDRPTPLEGPGGLRNWIEMFGNPFLSETPAAKREEYIRLAEEAARPHLLRNHGWFADYRRLRIVARKTD